MLAAAYRTPGVYVERLDANPQRIELRRTDVAGFVGLAERGPVHTAIKIESQRQFFTAFGAALAYGYLALAVTGFFENGGRTCWVVRVANPSQAAPARVGLSIRGREPFVLEATSPGSWGNSLLVEAGWGRDRITHLLVRSGSRSQIIDLDAPIEPRETGPSHTSLLGVDDRALSMLTEEELVRVLPHDQDLPLVELGAQASSSLLRGGRDGLEALGIEHFTGDPEGTHVWGMTQLEHVNDVAFVAAPDLMIGQDRSAAALAGVGFTSDQLRDAQSALLNSCLRCRDRVAILDVPPLPLHEVMGYKVGWPETSFGALYYPWITVRDAGTARGVRSIPPSGHLAGVYARTDRRRGVHAPPANAQLEGVFDAREPIDDFTHGELNETGERARAINAIRAIPGRGVLVLGARTLDPDLRFRYVNVRRLFAMIEEALEQQLQWLVFEPNNPRLWRDIDRVVRGFLERLYRLGMLDGASADDAYFVRCDTSTNPAEDTDAGRVRCVIGIQPPYPAEFVIVRIGVTRSGIDVEEKGAIDV